MSDRLYCTIDELVDDLEMAGVKAWKEDQVLDKIRAASDFIDNKFGMFIPYTEAKRIDGHGEIDLFIPPLLAVASIVNDGTTITSANYLLYPRNRHWQNGPYTRLSVDPDATQFSYWTDEEDVVVVTGRWGKYEESIDTGATVANTTSIAADGTSLLVGNGSKLSPGMVLLIEIEQLLVTATGAATDSTANTSEALDASEEEIDLNDASLVNTGEIVRIDFEQMRILDKLSNTVLAERGYNGTKRVAHTTSADVYVYRTFTVKRGANGTTAAAHNNGTAISRYIVPYDVNYLCRQVAALMMRKAETGFAGKTGNVELGEVFYHNEFPEQIEKVAKNYRIVSL